MFLCKDNSLITKDKATVYLFVTVHFLLNFKAEQGQHYYGHSTNQYVNLQFPNLVMQKDAVVVIFIHIKGPNTFTHMSQEIISSITRQVY